MNGVGSEVSLRASAGLPDGRDARIAVIIPAYKVTEHIGRVVATIPAFVERIYVVDDACPNQSGKVAEALQDPRVCVLFNAQNLGVGGAVMHGYRRAIEDGLDIMVKVDGDGQMDPAMMVDLIRPLLYGEADYAKGNRFYDLTYIGRMPPMRLFGNSVLSLLSKASTGYWDVMDPTNGYTALSADVASRMDFSKLSLRYFFETDLLFRLNTIRAVVVDVPMDARYGDEVSNLSISKVVTEFMWKHLRNICKRIFYSYFLRDFSIASIELVLGSALLLFGGVFGLASWFESTSSGIETGAGTVMVAALPVIFGLQLLLAFTSYDIARVPRKTIGRPAGWRRLLSDRCEFKH